MRDSIDEQMRRRIVEQPFWYHTIDVAPGLTTPGLFDLRAIVDDLPWPDVTGKRCLDVGTFDGFFAFEMEKRGAAEVVAVDVPRKELYDWPANVRPGLAKPDVFDLRPDDIQENGAGFRVAADALGSDARWQPISIYDLDPSSVGSFDVVVCSSLLLHLRDPIRALEAIRSVCSGRFMSFEPIDTSLTLMHRRKAVARFDGIGTDCQWWTPNGVAQVRMLTSAGFHAERLGRPMTVAYAHHPEPPRTLRIRARSTLDRLVSRTNVGGVVQRAVVAAPVL